MQIQDCGIIISKRLLEENNGIITVFTKEHGIYSGVVKNLYSPKSSAIYQLGNFVDFTWNARLSSHIGAARCELIKSYSSQIIYNKTKLYALNSILSLIISSLKAHEKYQHLFEYIDSYISKLITSQFSFLDYINAELYILESVGYSLDLSKCAVTSSLENLIYVSPKSGRAVSKEGSIGYEDQMLELPTFLITNNEPVFIEDIRAALNLTGYFFKRYVFHNQQEPQPRIMLYELELV